MSNKQSKIFKKLTMVAVLFAMVVSLIVPAKAEAAAKFPSLNAESATIVVGKSFNFNINNKIAGSTYEWTSSNTNVATVNKANGVVTGVSTGKTNIHCRITAKGKVYRLIAEVTVLKPAVKVTITNPIETLELKEFYRLKVQLTPATSNDKVTWTSSDKSIADIDEEGAFVGKKAGTVTLTAKTVSGRSAKVTVKVGGGGNAGQEENNNEETTPGKEDPKDDVKVIKTILKENFSKSAGLFGPRGGAAVAHTTAGRDALGDKGYISVTGRTAGWHGAAADLTSLVIPGATYRVTAWVRYTTGANVEVIKATQEAKNREGTSWTGITGDVEVKKGEWTQVTGTMVVDPLTTQCVMYFEANNLIDFYVDEVLIEQLDTAVKEAEVEEVVKAKVGDVVYKNDFEGDTVLNGRVNATVTKSTEQKYAGKASAKVVREKGWDGAGVRFNKANNINILSLYGMTVRVSAYVMYTEGPNEVEFKLNNQMEKVEESNTILSQKAIKKGEWTLIEADCYIAENTAGSMLFFETENDGALTFYVDNIEIKVVK